MKAGRLTEKIDILKPVVVRGDYGGSKKSYETAYYNVHATVKQKDGERIVKNNEIITDYTVTFTIRFYFHITEDMLIKWNGAKYRVCSLIKDRKTLTNIIITDKVNE